MTRLEIRQAVQDNTGRTDKDSVVNRGITLGLNEACRQHTFRETHLDVDYPIVAGQSVIVCTNNPTDLLNCRFIFGIMSYPVDIRSKDWLTSKFPCIEAMPWGKTAYVYFHDQKIYLYPLSIGSYVIRAEQAFFPVFADDTIQCPISYLEEYLIDYATATVFKSLQMFQEAQGHFTAAMAHLTSARLRDSKKLGEVREMEAFAGEQHHLSMDPQHDPFVKRMPYG